MHPVPPTLAVDDAAQSLHTGEDRIDLGTDEVEISRSGGALQAEDADLDRLDELELSFLFGDLAEVVRDRAVGVRRVARADLY